MRTPLIPLATLFAATLALGACGQKGPLYLPQDPAAPATSSSAAGSHSHGQPASTRAPEDKAQEDDTQVNKQVTKTESETEQHTEAEAVTK